MFAKEAFWRDMLQSHQKEHLAPYRNPEIDPDVSEEYRQILTTESIGYEYIPEDENQPIWQYKQSHFAVIICLTTQKQVSSGIKTLAGIYRGTAI